MKPLVLWARNQYPQPYPLRIYSRTPASVSGQIKMDGTWCEFQYDRQQLMILLDQDGHQRHIQLDEWGWEQ